MCHLSSENPVFIYKVDIFSKIWIKLFGELIHFRIFKKYSKLKCDYTPHL